MNSEHQFQQAQAHSEKHVKQRMREMEVVATDLKRRVLALGEARKTIAASGRDSLIVAGQQTITKADQLAAIDAVVADMQAGIQQIEETLKHYKSDE